MKSGRYLYKQVRSKNNFNNSKCLKIDIKLMNNMFYTFKKSKKPEFFSTCQILCIFSIKIIHSTNH